MALIRIINPNDGAPSLVFVCKTFVGNLHNYYPTLTEFALYRLQFLVSSQ